MSALELGLTIAFIITVGVLTIVSGERAERRLRAQHRAALERAIEAERRWSEVRGDD